MRTLIFLISLFYINASAAEIEGCKAVKDQFSYKIVMSEEYIAKFQDYDAAEKHCWDWKIDTQEIDMFSIDCMAREEDDHSINTIMSTRFISQYGDDDSAMQECWWLQGIQQSPEDYKLLSRTTSVDISSSYHMHRDHFDAYLESQERQQNISSDNSDENVVENPVSDDLAVCDQVIRFRLEINILDSQSYESLNCKADVVAINNDFDGHSEKLDNDNCVNYLLGLMELPGSYEIIINVPGYVQQKHDIEIDQDKCHVTTVKFDLLLDRI